MPKCDGCGQEVKKTYVVRMVDDVDYDEENNPVPIYAPWNMCAACVPEEYMDMIDEEEDDVNTTQDKE